MIFFRNFKEFEQTKDIFFRYCNHFKRLSQEELLNDITFIKYHQKMLKENPELTHYAYQVAVEASYSKRFFSQEALNEVFKEHFTIKDIYGLNNGLCDASTVNTALITEHIKTKSPFKAAEVLVASTPLEYHTTRYYDIQKSIKPLIQQSKNATGNTNCDLFIDGRPYDIKHTEKDHVNQSHILCWTHEKFNTHFESHLKNMLYIMQNILKNNETKSPKFFKQAHDKLDAIIKNKTMTLTEKNIAWQNFIHSNSSKIPPEFHFSLVFKMTDCDFMPKTPKSLLEKVHVSPDILEDPNKTLKAIKGILSFSDDTVKTRATVATNGLIDGLLHAISPDSTEILD